MSEKDTLEEKSSLPCEANPKEDSSSHSGGADITGGHRPRRIPYPEMPYQLVRTFV